jgi:hypothetical protein
MEGSRDKEGKKSEISIFPVRPYAREQNINCIRGAALLYVHGKDSKL